MSVPILSGRSIVKSFAARGLFSNRAPKRAVDSVDVDVNEGETLAIVGESGSGKSTLARMLLGLTLPTSGTINYYGRPIDAFTRLDWTNFRHAVQPVFQDPASSLNPRMRVETTLSNVLLRHKLATRDTLDGKISELLNAVGLDADQFHDRYPHQLSGGQQQRVAIARAIAVQPKLIVADEPLSSLDMSVQAQILNLLINLKTSRSLSLVMISHDLNVVDAIADRVIVMYLGKVVDAGPTKEVLRNPSNDYTRALLAAKLVADPHIARERRRAAEEAAAAQSRLSLSSSPAMLKPDLQGVTQ